MAKKVCFFVEYAPKNYIIKKQKKRRAALSVVALQRIKNVNSLLYDKEKILIKEKMI